MTGPLIGTGLDGAVTASFVTVRALSGGLVTTNMNGILARKLKAVGYDGLILEGVSPNWVYLHIDSQGIHDLLGTCIGLSKPEGQPSFPADLVGYLDIIAHAHPDKCDLGHRGHNRRQ